MNTATTPPMVRLSSWVRFIESGARDGFQIALHALRHRHGGGVLLERDSHEALLRCVRFQKMTPELEQFYREGLLVGYGEDPVSAKHALRKGNVAQALPEAELILAYEEAYWKEEFESNRNYKWRGRSICKSPDDLFFYQELIHDGRIESVLELGHGPGGSAAFFMDMFKLNRFRSDGTVQVYVGIDTEEPDQLPAHGFYPSYEHPLRGVRMWSIRDNAHQSSAYTKAAQLAKSDGHDLYGLVVVDADSFPMGRVHLMNQYAPLVAIGGYIVVEDTSTPEMTAHGDDVSAALDAFLFRSDIAFSIVPEASRFPTGRARVCLKRES